MTHIVQGAKTKKELKEKLSSNPASIYFSDPSIFPGVWSGRASDMQEGQSLTCTNHPKRTWFASVRKTSTGYKVG